MRWARCGGWATPQKMKGDEGWSLLHEAASWGSTWGVEMLMAAGDDPLFRCEKYGRTPLHWAVAGERADCIEILSRTAALDQRDNAGVTPLSLALGMLRLAGRNAAVILAKAGASPFAGENGESLVEQARLAGANEAWAILLASEQRALLEGAASTNSERKAPAQRL